MTGRVYLDWNAAAPLRPEARKAMIGAMDVVGNPSSVHAEGRAAKALVEGAREQVAQAVGCKSREVIFTSGATEAASVLGRFMPGHPVWVQPTAHDALWQHRRDGEGAAVLAMGLANSETGVITPLPERSENGWECGQGHAGWLMVDVTQAVGRIPFAFSWSGADMAVLSAHKLGGPKGVGALILGEGLEIEAIFPGGGQEMGRRSGTENVAGIAGFGAAAAAAMADLASGEWKKVAELRNILEIALASATKNTIFVGKEAGRLPNTTCFATPGWKGETQVMAMDLAGFAVSAGSACSSGKVRESRVLRAMGLGEDVARSAIRVSLGPTTREKDVTAFAEAWIAAEQKFRRRAA